VPVASAMMGLFRYFWRGLRKLTGDDAYERYISRQSVCRRRCANEIPSRAAFFREALDNRWNRPNRCC
jgi:uncharacterized short protein YbdD (DUF466 family)